MPHGRLQTLPDCGDSVRNFLLVGTGGGGKPIENVVAIFETAQEHSAY